jgi:multiple sugar transport system permease protein
MKRTVLISRALPALVLRGGILAALLVFLFFPIYWMFVTSVRPQNEVFVQFPSLWPELPTLENFTRAWGQSNLPLYLRNSFITAGGSALLTTGLAALAAYGFAKYRFAGRRSLMVLMISAQMFPFAVILISIYPLLQAAELLNTLAGLTVAYIVFALPAAIYILYSFFVRLPDELIEAARIDGAGDLLILARVVLPQSWPALIAVGIYSFMWAWNDLLYSLTLVTRDELRTIGPGLLLAFFGEMQQDWAGAMAASILAALPAVIIFGFLQRYFVQGLTAGAVKG